MAKSTALAALVLGIMACGSPSESEPDAVEERAGQSAAFQPANLVLSIGQEVTVPGANLRVRFDRVKSDSRCPIDAICITAGDAEIEITLSAGSAKTQHLLHWANSATRPGSASAAGYRVSLMQLEPMPKAATGAPAPGTYRLHLKVERS